MQYFASILAIAAVASAQCVQVVTQIGDGQVQAPVTSLSCPVSISVGSSTILRTVSSATTVVVPSTTVVVSTTQSPVVSTVAIPVISTASQRVITQIGDGQVQGPVNTTYIVRTSTSFQTVTNYVPVTLSNTIATSNVQTQPIVSVSTQVIPVTTTVTRAGNSTVPAISSVRTSVVLSSVPSVPATTTRSIATYTGAAAPTKAAGALGALVLGAAALVMA